MCRLKRKRGEEWLPSRRTVMGFTYLGMLFLVAIMGVALAQAATLWSTEARRDREAELLFVGDEFRRAIEAYVKVPVKEGLQRYPQRLEDLLEDKRGVVVKRHLRRVYRDPITGGAEWGLLRADTSIIGVYSLSEEQPFKQRNFKPAYAAFEGAKTYRDWKFMAAEGIDAAAVSIAARSAKPEEAVEKSAQPAVKEDAAPARYRTASECDKYYASDMRLCGQIPGDAPDGALGRCEASAQERQMWCALNQDGPRPPLAFQVQRAPREQSEQERNAQEKNSKPERSQPEQLDSVAR